MGRRLGELGGRGVNRQYFRRRQAVGCLAGCSLLGCALGCERGPQRAPATPSSAPSSQPAPEVASPPAPIPAWTREDAAARLMDEADSPLAALRLVQLASVGDFATSQPLTPEMPGRIRVARLFDRLWALGWPGHAEGVLRAPVFIDATGGVTEPVDGAEQESSVLFVSPRPLAFPHLLITPSRVLLILPEERRVALVARDLRGARFAVREEGDYLYLALELPAEQEAALVARYKWDPLEEVFMGPASDQLPAPGEGKFELDLESSPGLIPVGGEIPEPAPVSPPVPRNQPPEEPW